MITFKQQFKPYNPNELGRPWISKVTAWPEGAPPVTVFGDSRECNPDTGGSVSIVVVPGDIVRWGQKPKTVGPGAPKAEYPWAIVMASDAVRLVSMSEAREAFVRLYGPQPSSPGHRPFRGGSKPTRAPAGDPAPVPAPYPAPAPAGAPTEPARAPQEPPGPGNPKPPTSLDAGASESRERLARALRSIIDPVETALVNAEGFRERARRIVREALAQESLL